jgi:hypothetical protein
VKLVNVGKGWSMMIAYVCCDMTFKKLASFKSMDDAKESWQITMDKDKPRSTEIKFVDECQGCLVRVHDPELFAYGRATIGYIVKIELPDIEEDVRFLF